MYNIPLYTVYGPHIHIPCNYIQCNTTILSQTVLHPIQRRLPYANLVELRFGCTPHCCEEIWQPVVSRPRICPATNCKDLFVFCLFCVYGWHWLTTFWQCTCCILLYSVVPCEVYGSSSFAQSKGILAPVAWSFAATIFFHAFPPQFIWQISCSRQFMIWNRPCFYCTPFGNAIFECTPLSDNFCCKLFDKMNWLYASYKFGAADTVRTICVKNSLLPRRLRFRLFKMFS